MTKGKSSVRKRYTILIDTRECSEMQTVVDAMVADGWDARVEQLNLGDIQIVEKETDKVLVADEHKQFGDFVSSITRQEDGQTIEHLFAQMRSLRQSSVPYIGLVVSGPNRCAQFTQWEQTMQTIAHRCQENKKRRMCFHRIANIVPLMQHHIQLRVLTADQLERDSDLYRSVDTFPGLMVKSRKKQMSTPEAAWATWLAWFPQYSIESANEIIKKCPTLVAAREYMHRKPFRLHKVKCHGKRLSAKTSLLIYKTLFGEDAASRKADEHVTKKRRVVLSSDSDEGDLSADDASEEDEDEESYSPASSSKRQQLFTRPTKRARRDV